MKALLSYLVNPSRTYPNRNPYARWGPSARRAVCPWSWTASAARARRARPAAPSSPARRRRGRPPLPLARPARSARSARHRTHITALTPRWRRRIAPNTTVQYPHSLKVFNQQVFVSSTVYLIKSHKWLHCSSQSVSKVVFKVRKPEFAQIESY